MTVPPTTVSARAGSAATRLRGSAGNSSQSCPKVTLEIGVFFDGTLNNEVNSRSRGEGTSYENARTNVSLLKDRYKNGSAYDVRNSCGGAARKYRRLYVEGAGTSAGRSDDRPGTALGMGARGIENRVYEACVAIHRIIEEASPGVEPKEIIMDVFGFSRGAASARYFVNCFRQRFIAYQRFFILPYVAWMPEDRVVRFRFIGIFDTVAAVGIATNDNNGRVNVHLSTAQATRIYHLTAANEYRQNFRLNMNTPGGGSSRSMPGAHSDVGGGYRANGDNVTTRTWTEFSRTQEGINARRAELEMRNRSAPMAADEWQLEGWVYASDPPGTVSFQLGRTVPLFNRFSGITGYQFTVSKKLSRPWVRPGLSRIPLRIMYDQGVAAGVPFLSFPTTEEYAVPGPLADIGQQLIGGGSLTSAQTRRVLHDYAHISGNIEGFQNSMANAPERTYVRVRYPNIPGRAK
jgi:hypothetical protein